MRLLSMFILATLVALFVPVAEARHRGPYHKLEKPGKYRAPKINGKRVKIKKLRPAKSKHGERHIY